MADKKESKQVLERMYNIPLRKEWLKAPKYKRAKKAVIATKQFLTKHMKSQDIRLSADLNHKLWAHGMRNPPHHIAVVARKNDQGTVVASLSEVVKKKETLVQKRSRLALDKKAKAQERKAEAQKKTEEESNKSQSPAEEKIVDAKVTEKPKVHAKKEEMQN